MTILITLISVIVIILIGTMDKEMVANEINQSSDILRIHIRANSNSERDQNIKYQIKDLLLEFVTEDIVNLESKQEVREYFTKNKDRIEYLVNTFLEENGFNYQGKLSISNEYFPTRMYGDKIVSSGNYDAVILSLGETKGENWWCIAYPTICFEDYQKLNDNVVYKSRLLDIINKIFD